MPKLTSNRRLLSATLLGVLCSFLHSRIYTSLPLDDWMLQAWFSQRGAITAPDDVMIVAVDDQSYANLGVSKREVWPRRLQTQLLQKLAQGGAKVVAFDMAFQGKSNSADEDRQLAEALRLLPTIIPRDTIVRLASNGAGYQTEEIESLPIFRQAAAAEARVTLFPKNGMVDLFGWFEPNAILPAENLAQRALSLAGEDRQRPRNLDLLNFYGPPGSVRTISFDIALADSTPKEIFTGKIIFVGTQIRLGNSVNVLDAYRIPFKQLLMFGVEIFATQAANLLENNYIRRIKPKSEALLMGLGFMLLSILVLTASVRRAILIAAGASLFWLGASYLAFLQCVFIPGASAVFLLLLVLLPLNWAVNFFVTKDLFKHFLPGQTVEKLVANPEMVSEHRTLSNMAMMFTDIKGYSGITEQRGEDMRHWIFDAYDSIFQDVVERHKGLEIRSGGDEKFVGWSKEFGNKRPCVEMLACAMELRKALGQAAKEGRIPALTTRIGLHHGDALLGLFGAGKALRFTAKGDNVNVAARLEGINEGLGTTVLLSSEVIENVTEQEGSLYMGRLVPEGRREAVAVFTIPEDEMSLDSQLRGQWRAALEFFAAKRWGEATRAFERVSEHPCLEQACALYLHACSAYDPSKLAAEWRGEIWVSKKGALIVPAALRLGMETEGAPK